MTTRKYLQKRVYVVVYKDVYIKLKTAVKT